MNAHALHQSFHPFFGWLWQTSAEATVLILLALVAQWIFGRILPVKLRYALGLLILVRLLMPALPASSLSIFNLGRQFSAHSPALEKSTPQTPLPETTPLAVPQPLAPRLPPPAAHQGLSAILLAEIAWAAGFSGIFLVALRQHWKLSRWVRSQPPVADHRVMALLEELRLCLGIRKKIRITFVAKLKTPAVFGFWRPRLLLPEGLPDRLTPEELRLVLMHELIHIRRRDVLLNWLIILVRSLHWFNPFVWLAMKRLRADIEIVCDARVLASLGPDERRAYGHTLLKLLADYSATRLCPSLVPLFTSKKLIQRRIAMIANFKSTSRPALAVSAALLVAIGLFTCTRAAEKTTPTPARPVENASAENEPPPAPTVIAPPPQARTASDRENVDKMLQALRQQLDIYDERVVQLERDTDSIREKLAIPSDVAEGSQHSSAQPNRLMAYDHLRIENESECFKSQTLLDELKKLDRSVLPQALSTACPDSVLTSLLQQFNSVQIRIAALSSNYGKDYPEVRSAAAEEASIREKIDERVKGIFAGMEVHIAAIRAAAHQSAAKADQSRKDDVMSFSSYRPYFQRKEELEKLKKMRDVLALREAELRVQSQLPTPVPSP